MTVRRLSAVALVVLVLIGCGGSAPSLSPSQTPVGQDPNRSTFANLFARMGPDGEVDKQLAIDAFSLAIAPLPGAQPAVGTSPQSHELASGTFAVRWIRNHYEELTDEQRGIVDRALAPGPDAVTVMPEASGGSSALIAATGGFDGHVRGTDRFAAIPDTHEAYVAIAKEAVNLIAQRLGRNLNIPYYVYRNDEDRGEANTLAYANEWSLPSIGGLGCGVHINPRLRSGYDDTAIRVTIAHEMFHCFQFVIIGSRAFWESAQPAWVIEGQAEYVGEVVMGPSTVGQGWWESYIKTPHYPLNTRSYDAVGFYLRLQEINLDPWKHLDAMLRTIPNSEEAYKAANATADEFAYSWGSSFVRQQEWGVAWDAEPLWNTSAKYDWVRIIVPLNVPVAVAARKWTNEVYQAETSHDIVEVRVEGFGRLHLSGGDILDLEQLWLCMKGECKCPEGERYSGPTLVPASSPFQLGLTGGLSGTQGTLTGHELKEFCEPKASPAPDVPCDSGCSSSTGEPHLTTVDDVGYDFQATGEYVLLRSPDGVFELQSRQVPLRDGLPVTVNSAMAMRVGDKRVAVYIAPDRDPLLEVRVDGEVVNAATPIDLGDGARVAAYSGGVQVDFADGSQLWALPTGEGCCINILLAASEELKADGVGLLGDVTPGGAPLPALPDGTRLPRPSDRHDQFVQLYEQLGPAWLVTQETSLFDYGPGESTATFLLPGFPAESEYRTLEDLPADVRAAGEAACGDVTDEERFFECVFDVSLADFIDWAEGYTNLIELEEQGPVVIGAPPSQPPPPPPDELPEGFLQVADDVARIDGTRLSEDGRLYLTVRDNSDKKSVMAVDVATGEVVAETALEHYGPLAIASGSIWVGAAKDFDCLVKRLDRDSLAEIASIPIECDIFGSQFAALGDDIWYLDRTTADIDARGGTLRRIDAATNEVGRAASDAVTVPFTNGYLLSSDEAIFWRADALDESGDRQIYRLDLGATELEALGPPDGLPILPGGRGVWAPIESELGLDAVYRTSAGAPDSVLPVDGIPVAGDATAVYVASHDFDATPILLRYPVDGGPPDVVATGLTLETSTGQQTLDYIGLSPLPISNGLLAMVWLVPTPDNPNVTELILQATRLP